MPKSDPKVSRYIQSRAPFARPILKRLRKAIRGGSSDLEEAVKWGMPAFLHRGKIVCGIAGFKRHCALWFWNSKAVIGASAKDGMGQFGRLTDAKDLPSAARIKRYVKTGMKLIDKKLAAR